MCIGLCGLNHWKKFQTALAAVGSLWAFLWTLQRQSERETLHIGFHIKWNHIERKLTLLSQLKWLSPKCKCSLFPCRVQFSVIKCCFMVFSQTCGNATILRLKKTELTSTILVAKVREPPHVPEANDLSCHSQQELNFAGPLSSTMGAGCWVAFHLQIELGLWTKMGIHCSATTSK